MRNLREFRERRYCPLTARKLPNFVTRVTRFRLPLILSVKSLSLKGCPKRVTRVTLARFSALLSTDFSIIDICNISCGGGAHYARIYRFLIQSQPRATIAAAVAVRRLD